MYMKITVKTHMKMSKTLKISKQLMKATERLDIEMRRKMDAYRLIKILWFYRTGCFRITWS